MIEWCLVTQIFCNEARDSEVIGSAFEILCEDDLDCKF